MLIYKQKADKYILYARKSTDEVGKQERSIEDQLTYCRELAKRDGLIIVQEVTEMRSAKVAHKRPLFKNMLEQIQKGKADGIIAYHPDRIARNMLEAGIFIDMVDHDIIKDLRFCTQHFSTDANGKMLLGMAFVLGKQYSDKISDDVGRARDLLHAEGTTNGIVKAGYERDEKTGRYVKGKFWEEIRHAWRMKLQGKKVRDIVQYLDASGYHREIKKGEKARKYQPITEQKLSRMFLDPLYYGECIVDGVSIRLRDKYDFEPMVTEEEFYMISKDSRSLNYHRQEGKPLKGKIFDLDSPEIEYKPQIIKNGKGNVYLMYVVDPKVKQAIAKKTGFDYPGIRAKTLVSALNRHFEQMYETLAKNKQKFDTYMRTAKKELIEMQDSRKNDVMVARKTRNRVQNDMNELLDSYMITGKSWTDREKARYEEKKVDLEEKLVTLDEQITDLQEKLEASEMTLDDFLNTIESLITSYQSRSGDDKLKIAEILVLNIFIKG